MTTLATMTADIQSYTTYDADAFVAAIPTFIKSAEERIWYFVQLPFFRKAQTGIMTSGNAYLQLPSDFLAPSSLSIDTGANGWKFLLNKDVEYVREVYPVVATTGEPVCYALFDADEDDTTIIIGPTPDSGYTTQLNYYFRPASLTTDPAGGTWLSNHAYDTLLYGALSESSNYLKKEAGIDSMADTYEQRFIVGLQGLKNLGEQRDRKDTYRRGEG